MNSDQLMRLVVAGGIVFAAYKWGNAEMRTGALAITFPARGDEPNSARSSWTVNPRSPRAAYKRPLSDLQGWVKGGVTSSCEGSYEEKSGWEAGRPSIHARRQVTGLRKFPVVIRSH